MCPEPESIQLTVTVTSTNLLEGLKKPENRTVWQQFVGRYRPMIINYARNRFGLTLEDAEEAAQATLMAFATAYRQGGYERDRGRLRKWLFGIATRQTRNQVRKKARNQEVQMPGQTTDTMFADRIPDDDAGLEEAWEAEWRRAVYGQCMVEIRAQFDSRTVEAFERFAQRGRPAQEVADSLGMTPNAVFLAKHKILKRIRELLPLVEENW
jgi:RNA polymerase sigma-70 factor (ECF subfamily)